MKEFLLNFSKVLWNNYDDNCVVAAGGESGDFTFDCVIIDDRWCDLSIDALNTAFQNYVENNYPEDL